MVEGVKGTGVKDNIHAFDQVFSRHGFPTVLFSDNGAPFNGNRHHELQEYFRFAGISHKPNRSPLDPEVNRLDESFMKHCKKIWLTSVVKKKDPVLEINKHLRTVRSTPHISKGQIPVDLLFEKKIQRKDFRHKEESSPR